jgi:hypothetical protein
VQGFSMALSPACGARCLESVREICTGGHVVRLLACFFASPRSFLYLLPLPVIVTCSLACSSHTFRVIRDAMTILPAKVPAVGNIVGTILQMSTFGVLCFCLSRFLEMLEFELLTDEQREEHNGLGSGANCPLRNGVSHFLLLIETGQDTDCL